jgi:hypothetical protein
MKAFRRGVIFFINAVILLFLLKVILLDPAEGVGAFGIAAFIFVFIYNVYALVVYTVFWDNPRRFFYLEIAYVFLLSIPLLFLWQLTS